MIRIVDLVVKQYVIIPRVYETKDPEASKLLLIDPSHRFSNEYGRVTMPQDVNPCIYVITSRQQ